MKLNQEKVTKLEEKVASLMNENQSLKVRAAVSFDELTPRPSFSNVILFSNDIQSLII